MLVVIIVALTGPLDAPVNPFEGPEANVDLETPVELILLPPPALVEILPPLRLTRFLFSTGC